MLRNPRAAKRAKALNLPENWESALPSGLLVAGTEDRELPLVRFNVVIDGAQLMDSLDWLGAENLGSPMLTRGSACLARRSARKRCHHSARRSMPARGKSISSSPARPSLRNFEATIALLEETLLEARGDRRLASLLAMAALSLVLSCQPGRGNEVLDDASERLVNRDVVR
jgi:zinc protease